MGLTLGGPGADEGVVDCVGALGAGRPAEGTVGTHLTRASRLDFPSPSSLGLPGPYPSQGVGGWGWRPPGGAAAGGANPESLGVSPSCRGTPWWRAEKPPFPTPALLGTLVSSLPPLWAWPRVAQTNSFLCLTPAFSGSLGLAKVPRSPAAAHLRDLPAASPRSAPPARFWILFSFSPTSPRHCPTSASPLPWNP